MDERKVTELVAKFKRTGQRVSVASVIDVLHSLMVFAEQVDGLTGVEKKKLVLVAIDRIIKESVPNDDPEYALLEQSLRLVVPFVIDKLVYADKGGLALHPKVVKKCQSLFRCC